MINYCLKEIEASIKEYKTIIENLRTTNDKLQAKIDWYKEEDKANNENLEKAYEEINKLEKQLRNKNKTTNNKECNCNKHKHNPEYSDLEKINNSLRKQLTETGTKRKQLEKQNQQLIDTLTQYKKENNLLKGENINTNNKFTMRYDDLEYENMILKKMLLDTIDDYYSKGLLVDGEVYDKNRVRGMKQEIKVLGEDCKYYRDDCIHRLDNVPHIYRNRIGELESRVKEQEELITTLQDDANIQMIKDYERHHDY